VIKTTRSLRLSTLCALCLAACSPSNLTQTTPSGAGGDSSAQGISATVQPSTASLAPRETTTFSASVFGTADARVSWRVAEPNSGTVDSSGRYTAPSTAGVYHVVATSLADDSVSAQAEVTVDDPSGPSPSISAFAASPATIAAGATSTLSWDVSGATSLSIDQGVGAVTGASVSVSPSAATTYTLTARNAAGSTTATTVVTVTAGSGGGTGGGTGGDSGTTIATCQDLPTDASGHSRAAVSLPGYVSSNPSGTYVTDSYTGARITRVTGNPGSSIQSASGASLGVSWGTNSGPMYAKEPAWNADGSWLQMHLSSPSGYLFLDGNTYAPLWFRGNLGGLSGVEIRPLPPATTWIADPQDYVAYIDGDGNAGVYNPATNAATRRYTAEFGMSTTAGGGSGFGWTGGEAAIADDGRLVVVNAVRDSDGHYVAFAVDLSSGSRVSPVIDFTASPLSFGQYDWASISTKGNYIIGSTNWSRIVAISITGACATTFSSGCITQSGFSMGHFDVATLPDGTEAAFNGGNPGYVALGGGGLVTVGGPSMGDYWHTSARNVSAPGWGFVSHDQTGDALSGEIYALELRSGGALKRIVHTNRSGNQDYWHFTFAVPSPDGRRVFYRSDWGDSGGPVYGFVADVRSVCP